MDDSPLAGTLTVLAEFFVGQDSLEDTLQWVVELATVAIGPVAFAGITLPSEGRQRTAAFSDPLSPQIDQAQYESQNGPCLDAMRDRVVHVVDATGAPGPWPEYRRAAAERGIRSTLSVPLIVGDRVVGAMNLYSRREAAFGDEDRDAASSFARQAAVLLANSKAYWEAQQLSVRLDEAMKTRATIEQAKGILMGAQGCSPDEAFDLLRRASQRENVKLRDVAQRIVDRATGALPPESSTEVDDDL